MAPSYERVATALMWHDPRNLHWQPRTGVALGRATEQRLERLRHRAALSLRGASLADAFGHMRALARERAVGTVEEIDFRGRLPLVLAHGPSLTDLLPAIRANRDRLCLIVPYRTAVHLASCGVWSDVVVLADRGPTPYRISDTLWTETPPGVRAELGTRAVLVMDPLAPASIHRGFTRAVLLDDGTGLSAGRQPLPFWGYALLTCLALPLARGAQAVALAGIDLKASAGPLRRTWHGEAAHLDARFAGLLALIEVLASCDRAVYDLSASAVAKANVRHRSLEDYLRLPAPTRQPSAGASPTADWLDGALQDLLAHLEAQSGVIESIGSLAREGLQLTTGPRGTDRETRVADVLQTIERRWAQEPRYREVLATMQPTYLMGLAQLRKARVPVVNPTEATWRTTRLLCLELADLAEDHRRRLQEARQSMAAGAGPAAV